MTIIDYLELFAKWWNSPRVSDNISTIAWGIIIGSLILEFSKVKVSPWAWVFKKLGKALNSETSEELKVVNERLTKIEEWQDRTQHLKEKDRALDARRRILRARNDILNGSDINLEYMRNLMADISTYEDYCNKHSDSRDEWHFHNKECPEAIETLTTYYHSLERRVREEALQKNKND